MLPKLAGQVILARDRQLESEEREYSDHLHALLASFQLLSILTTTILHQRLHSFASELLPTQTKSLPVCSIIFLMFWQWLLRMLKLGLISFLLSHLLS